MQLLENGSLYLYDNRHDYHLIKTLNMGNFLRLLRCLIVGTWRSDTESPALVFATQHGCLQCPCLRNLNGIRNVLDGRYLAEVNVNRTSPAGISTTSSTSPAGISTTFGTCAGVHKAPTTVVPGKSCFTSTFGSR